MFTRRAKPIRIIGDWDNQRPDKCSSTVYHIPPHPPSITISTFLIDCNLKVLIDRCNKQLALCVYVITKLLPSNAVIKHFPEHLYPYCTLSVYCKVNVDRVNTRNLFRLETLLSVPLTNFIQLTIVYC